MTDLLRFSPRLILASPLLCAALLAGCAPSTPKDPVPATKTDTVVSKPPQVGGQDVVLLSRGRSGNGDQPEFLSAALLPGRGLNTVAISAWVPGRGETQLIVAPPLDEVAKLLQGDAYGNKSFTLGGPFLIPFANRIRGKAVHDGKDIEIEWHGRKVTLPANWVANNDGTPMAGHEAHAMHGLILAEKTDGVSTAKTADGESFTGVMHAGDFGGHWFSQNDITVTCALSGNVLDYQVTVRNVGKEAEPMAIGWHPYFALPSGDRGQALLHIPASDTAEVNNYDDVFPTGKLLPVAGTPLDFNAPGGSKLPDKLLDDSFTNLKRNADGNTVVELRDPAAKYGLRLTAVGPDFQAIQAYSPPDKKFVAIEPQYNLGDPLGKEWKGRNTGMVTLKPGESTTWHVKLELFIP
jgi:galactose mutarotase-like enzyme